MFEQILREPMSERGMSYQCEVPQSLRPGFRKGLYRVYGSIVKDTETGRIAGHLQQTSSSRLLDVAQTFSTAFHVAGIASSVLNLGVSVMTLSKVNRMVQQLESIEQRLETIEQRMQSMEKGLETIERKIDLVILDKMRNSLTELKEIERTHMRVFFELEESARNVEAGNIRSDLRSISAVLVNELNKSLESEELNSELCVSLIEALELYQQMYVFTLFVTSQFRPIEGFSQREIEQIRNFINVLKNKSRIKSLEDCIDRSKSIAVTTHFRTAGGDWKEDVELAKGFQKSWNSKSDSLLELDAKWEDSRRLIIDCCEDAVRTLESLTSLTDTLRQRNISGERYLEMLTQSEWMGPVVYVPAPNWSVPVLEFSGSR